MRRWQPLGFLHPARGFLRCRKLDEPRLAPDRVTAGVSAIVNVSDLVCAGRGVTVRVSRMSDVMGFGTRVIVGPKML